MQRNNYLKLLVEDIHSTTVAAIGADGHPQARVIDMMLWDEQGGYFVGSGCIGCKLCCSVCPQKCIDITKTPVVIDQHRCLRCGCCAETCPRQIIEKRG